MWLPRAFCWTGAIVDAIASAVLLSPTFAQRMLSVPEVPLTPALLYAMRTGAALMIGWTCLLLWAGLRPVERRGVILLTVVPVIAGLGLTEVLAIEAGFLDLMRTAPLLVLQGLLASFGVVAYVRARPTVGAS
jgi:hypothetical protein